MPVRRPAKPTTSPARPLTGSVNYNLRGLGADKTLVLLNGRRMSQNTSNIPSAALARTEILKDGAAVIYGADATGGVVNFITRDDFVGLEVGGQYKMIDGSDGDYSLQHPRRRRRRQRQLPVVGRIRASLAP